MPTGQQVDAVFDVLASPVRREILDLLRQSPLSVNEIAEHFDMRRPSVSEHLRRLLDVDLVTVEVDGRRRVHHVAARPLADVADWLHPYERFWRNRVSALAGHLEAEAEGE